MSPYRLQFLTRILVIVLGFANFIASVWILEPARAWRIEHRKFLEGRGPYLESE